MIYLVGQIWIWLLIALVLGGLLAWLWLRMTAGRRVEDQLSPWRDRVSTLERERDALRREVGEVRDRATESETQLAALRERMQEQEARFQEQAVESREADVAASSPDEDAEDRVPDGPLPATDAPAVAEPAAVTESERDDLTRIKGIGRVLQGKLNELDIMTFARIAAFSDDDIARVNEAIGFKGRVEREDWIGQARALNEAHRTSES